MKGKNKWKGVVLMTAVLVSLTVGQVFAAVTPSVSQNPAPKIVGAVTYTDANGNVITIDTSRIKIVADADVGTMLTPEQRAVYEKAKAELTNPDSQYNKDLEDFLTKNYPGIPADSIVVREIFDISVEPELSFDKSQKLEVTLSGNYKQGDMVIVTIYNKDTGKWEFIESSDVTINADGTLTVKFPHLTPVAILVADKDAITTVPSEEGGISTSTILLVLGAVVVILAVVVVVIKKKTV